MSFKTDAGGFAFKCGDIKLQGGSSSWASRLSQLGKMKGCVRILTYSLPDLESIRGVLSKRPKDIFIIANPKAANVESRAEAIKEEFPNIRIALNEETHSKVFLIAPDSLMVSSANFGKSGWHETTVSFHQKEAHDHYIENDFEPLWNMSEEVADPVRLESLSFSESNTEPVFLNLRGSKTTDEGLSEKLKGLTKLIRLNLGSTKITDAGLVHLKGFTNLEYLYLAKTKVTDAGLVHLRGLTELKGLGPSKTKITDAGLVHLKGLTKLKWLWLNNTKIIDAGLVHLKGLTKLELLDLRSTKVTDAGLVHLKGLTNLEKLWLNWTRVTPAGVHKLQEALPCCQILAFTKDREAQEALAELSCV